MSMPVPLVTIVIPCRNEEDWIGPCLDSILQNDYPKDRLDVLVIDGMSNDGTRSALQPFLEQHSSIRLLDNPQKTTPAALNVGIAAAQGEVIMRMDAHYEYPTNYISRLVHWLQESGADNVGGVLRMEPATDAPMARAIAVAVTHPFGIGNAYYRLGVSKPRSVDTVPFGCYRREVFERIGNFDEDLLRNQDLEFNLRPAEARRQDPACARRGDPRSRPRFGRQTRPALLSVRLLQPAGDVETLRQGQPATNRHPYVCAQSAGNGYPRTVVSSTGPAVWRHFGVLCDGHGRQFDCCGAQTRRGLCPAPAVGICGHAFQPRVGFPPWRAGFHRARAWRQEQDGRHPLVSRKGCPVGASRSGARVGPLAATRLGSCRRRNRCPVVCRLPPLRRVCPR